MKEPSDNLDFIKPFGNQEESLTDTERMEAAYRFSALVDDLLLRFAGDVRIYDHTVVPEGREASLTLVIPLEADGKISVIVESSSKDDGTGYKEVSLGNYLGNYRHQYYMESYEEALRCDRKIDTANIDTSGLIWLPSGLETSIIKASNTDTVTYETAIEKSLAGLADTRNESENQRLEGQLGVNHQPVGPDEIGRLAQLLEGAETIGAI